MRRRQMSIVEALGKAQLFTDLSQEELERIAAVSEQRRHHRGDTILNEGETSRELFIIIQGSVGISLRTAEATTPVINLGTGQVFGEMTLVDRGARSATARALEDPTVLHVIPHKDFLRLCEEDNHIGFIVMRNLAAEMSLRLRLHNITRVMEAGQ
jgi:CRP/FNR family cyclic AMP-dependent transcriptional regulator